MLKNCLLGNFALNIVKYVVKSDHIAGWFLDDFQGNAFPLLRVVLTSMFHVPMFFYCNRELFYLS